MSQVHSDKSPESEPEPDSKKSGSQANNQNAKPAKPSPSDKSLLEALGFYRRAEADDLKLPSISPSQLSPAVTSSAPPEPSSSPFLDILKSPLEGLKAQKPKAKEFKAKEITPAPPPASPKQPAVKSIEKAAEEPPKEPEHAPDIMASLDDLPVSYGSNLARLSMIDPERLLALWDLSEGLDALRGVLSFRVLQHVQGRPIEIERKLNVERSGSWYVNTEPNSLYQLELGVVDGHGQFTQILRSNMLETPRVRPRFSQAPVWRVREPIIRRRPRVQAQAPQDPQIPVSPAKMAVPAPHQPIVEAAPPDFEPAAVEWRTLEEPSATPSLSPIPDPIPGPIPSVIQSQPQPSFVRAQVPPPAPPVLAPAAQAPFQPVVQPKEPVFESFDWQPPAPMMTPYLTEEYIDPSWQQASGFEEPKWASADDPDPDWSDAEDQGEEPEVVSWVIEPEPLPMAEQPGFIEEIIWDETEGEITHRWVEGPVYYYEESIDGIPVSQEPPDLSPILVSLPTIRWLGASQFEILPPHLIQPEHWPGSIPLGSHAWWRQAGASERTPRRRRIPLGASEQAPSRRPLGASERTPRRPRRPRLPLGASEHGPRRLRRRRLRRRRRWPLGSSEGRP